MEYYSTMGKSAPVDLKTAILNGIAPDGGLYMPARIPRLPKAFINNMPEMSVSEIAYVVANTLFGDDIDSATLKRIVDEALDFSMPMVDLGNNLSGIELFHGPTHSFKDIGTRFMSRLLSYYKKTDSASQRPTVVIVATSGNGGSAVAAEVLNHPDAHTFILYPAGKLSPIEEAQFTTIGGRVHALEVSGDFDQCHRLAVELIKDSSLQSRIRIISANSLNIAQLLPQAFYFFYAYAQLSQQDVRPESIVLGVPSGNLGNLAGGVIAKEMGLPISRFVTAGNHFVLSHFIQGSSYSANATAQINDVSKSANFYRIARLYGGSTARLAEDVSTYHCDNKDIADTINTLYISTGYLVEPNAAAVIRAMRHELKPSEKGVVLLPTHPAKKTEVIDFITGQCVNVPHDLASVRHKPGHQHKVPASLATVRNIIMQSLKI